MAERGNLERCLSLARHHVAPHKIRLLAFGGSLNINSLSYRFKLVDDNLQQVENKLQEVREAAERGDCEDVLRVLNEDFDF